MPNPASDPEPTPLDSLTRRSSAIDEAMRFLYGRINYERLGSSTGQFPFRLARMRGLLRELGDPDQAYRVIHIGGTKGKGSTSAMVAAMLAAGGLRTGLYTSPHLNDLGERFQVDGRSCTDDQLVDLVAQVREAAERLERDGKGAATFFELTTAVAMLHFQQSRCDAAVLEVGLGGRLDSTNVCDPLVTAITSVGLDHQHILGDTHEKIAAEKAGILKPGIPAVSGVVDGPAAEVIAAQARRVGAPLWQVGRDFTYRFDEDFAAWGSRFDLRASREPLVSRTQVTTPLEGRHQAANAAVALAIVDLLAHYGGPTIDDATIRDGLMQTVSAARLERFALKPTMVLDAAHNVDSVAALTEVLDRRTQGRPVAVVFGTSVDKDYAGQLELLARRATAGLWLTRFHSNPRWRDPHEMTAAVNTFSTANEGTCRVEPNPSAALEAARRAAGAEGWVVICGSFFLAAELRPQLLQEAGRTVR